MKNTEIKIVIFDEGDNNYCTVYVYEMVLEFTQFGGFYNGIGVNELHYHNSLFWFSRAETF